MSETTLQSTSEAIYHGLSREQIRDVLTRDSKLEQGLTAEDISSSYGIQSTDADYIATVLRTENTYADRFKSDGTPGLEPSVFAGKYLAPNEKGPLYLWDRIAGSIANQETESEQDSFYSNFLQALDNFEFIPGGRIMHGAGRTDIKTTLNNCYVVGIKDDSMRSILQTLEDEAMTYKMGGGCGHDLSVLRPRNAKVNGTGGGSCGPVGFMELYSVATDTIAQHGRRGANMQTLRVEHPDIQEFIGVKKDLTKVKKSNISVLLTHEFMNALENDADFNLRFPDIDAYQKSPETVQFYKTKWNGDFETWEAQFREAQKEGAIPSELKPFKIHSTVKATEVWNSIIENAHAVAEPGIIFWDTMKDYHNAQYVSPLVSTNPCGEQPLPDGGCCNLAAVNLERFVTEDGEFRWDDFKNRVRTGVRYLDNVIGFNLDRHALQEQKENATNDRRIGLGILGLGDALLGMKIKYDSPEALEFADQLGETFRDTAYQTSIELAKEKGTFPNFDWEGYSKSKFVQNLPMELQEQIKEYGIRNATILTVAPTGSGAIIGQTSSGIEPILYFVSKRDLRNVTEKKQEFKLTAPIVKKRNLDLDNLPEHAITAHDVAPEFRVKMQGTLQKYIDSSISSTVNLPEDVSVETVSQIYIDAYKNGLKGITVYREGSREGVIRNAKKESTLERKTKVDWHPSLKIGFDNEDYVFSKKYEIATPEGPLHVSFTTDDRGFPIEVFANIGPLGSTKSSNIAVSGLRDSRYLQQTEDPNILQMVKDFGSVKGDKSSGFGESKIDSWQHGYSIILKQHAESFGIIGKDEHGFLTQKVHKKRGEGDKIYLEKNGNGHKVHEGDLKGEGEEDNVCTKCGGRMSIPKEGGCKTLSCPDCGAGGCD